MTSSLLKGAVDRVFPSSANTELEEFNNDMSIVSERIKQISNEAAIKVFYRNPVKLSIQSNTLTIEGPGENATVGDSTLRSSIVYTVENSKNPDGTYKVKREEKYGDIVSSVQETATTLKDLYDGILEDVKSALPRKYHKTLRTMLTGTPESATQALKDITFHPPV